MQRATSPLPLWLLDMGLGGGSESKGIQVMCCESDLITLQSAPMKKEAKM